MRRRCERLRLYTEILFQDLKSEEIRYTHELSVQSLDAKKTKANSQTRQLIIVAGPNNTTKICPFPSQLQQLRYTSLVRVFWEEVVLQVERCRVVPWSRWRCVSFWRLLRLVSEESDQVVPVLRLLETAERHLCAWDVFLWVLEVLELSILVSLQGSLPLYRNFFGGLPEYSLPM